MSWAWKKITTSAPGLSILSAIVTCTWLLLYKTGPGCSKLTMWLVNVSLKFQTLISQICQYFLLEKWDKLLQCKSFSHCFKKKKFSVFGYKVIKHLASWPLNKLIKLMMLWTTGPWCISLHVCILFRLWKCISNNYTMFFPPVRGGNLHDLAHRFTPVRWTSHGITIITWYNYFVPSLSV